MNKYSLKIMNFINKIKFKDENIDLDLSNKINVNHILIKKIRSIMKYILESQTTTFNTEKFSLGKLHSDKYPLMYLFFREYLKSTDEQITIDSYKSFVNWFNLNQHKIDYNEIYKNINSNKKLVEMFNNMLQINLNREHLHENLHKNVFVGLDTIHYSETVDLEEYIIESEYAKLYLYFEKGQLIEELILRILNIVTIMHKINKEIIKSKTNKLELIVFLGKQRKQTFNNDILTPININSGSCYRKVLVNVWREEELEKVLFHELLHFYECDFHIYESNYNLLKSFVQDTFSIDNDSDKVNESINEMMAILLHMIYQSERLHMDLNIIYSYEIFFSMFQVAKIITFYNGSSYENLFKSNPNNIKIKQTTSVLSYFIIKCLLLFNINSTLDYLDKVNLKVDNNNILTYKDYLEEIITNKEIGVLIDKLIRIYNELDSDKFISRTLRMSAIN